MSSTESPLNKLPPLSPLKKAAKDALGGGLPGGLAMAAQVSTLMWMRTTVNFQYRHGRSFPEAFRVLYRDGGMRRFYRGYGPAMLLAPLSRFGDTAANAGMLSLFSHYEVTRNTPLPVQTLASSLAAAGFRTLLMPIDTLKTTLQIEGAHGGALLRERIRAQGHRVLFRGSLAASGATFAGHYPWFVTYNYLNAALPPAPMDATSHRLARSAFIGFCASFASDCVSNSIRVLKTCKQTSDADYIHTIRTIGARELMTRGLGTKVLTNGIQGVLFSVLWRLGQDAMSA